MRLPCRADPAAAAGDADQGSQRCACKAEWWQAAGKEAGGVSGERRHLREIPDYLRVWQHMCCMHSRVNITGW